MSDESNTMDTTSAGLQVTPLRQAETHANYDFASDSLSASPALKRMRTKTSSESTETVDKDQGVTMSSILSQTEDSLLPTVDSAAVCSACSIQVALEHILCCSSCSKKFHGNCKELEILTKRGVNIAPSNTSIKDFNHIMKFNHSYLSGRFSWTCNSCVAIKALCQNKFLEDRLAMLESAFTQQKQVLPLVEQLVLSSKNQKNAHNKSRSGHVDQGFSYRDSLLTGNSDDAGQKTPGAPLDQRNSQKVKAVKKFKVNLSNGEDPTPIRKILSARAAKGDFDEYDYKPNGKNSIDLLFNSLDEAKKEHKKLVDNLDTIKVSEPDINNRRKAFLVGLSYYDEKEDVSDYLHKKYGDALKLDGENKDCLQVLSVDPCNTNQDLYRATLLVSDDVLAIIRKKFNNRLRVSYVTCTVYPVKPHRRCFKCQKHGHMQSKCQEETPTCSKCAGSHYSDKCTATGITKCANCFKSEDHKSRCNDHTADSSDCPVFREYRAKSKN